MRPLLDFLLVVFGLLVTRSALAKEASSERIHLEVDASSMTTA
ncbi:MAG TPA: hypothetical protein VM925_27630 [Labilithrix sp.]|nr:hypothetical protein [Labilithrix sp.]